MRIRELRVQAGMTQAQLAEAADVTDETISRIERGAYEPALSTMMAVTRALGVGLEYLETGVVAGDGKHEQNPQVRRLAERAEKLDPAAVKALITLAELMPTKPDAKGKPRKPR